MRTLLILLLISSWSPALLHAQSEKTPVLDADQAGQARKADEQPREDSLTRLMRRALGLVEKKVDPNQPAPGPKISGVKWGIKGMGAGSGTGLELKPYHNSLFGRGIEVETPLLITHRLYESAGARVNFPLIRGGSLDRLGIEGTARYISRPSDRFFGIGNDPPSMETRFRTVSRNLALALDARVNPAWTARLEGGYRNVGVTHPRHFLSAQEVFQDQEAPGLFTGATMVSAAASLQRNTKDRALTSGGLQRFEVSRNDSIDKGDFSYWRYSIDLEQLLPLSKDHRKVLALRAGLETNQERSGSAVPFFDLPTLGSRSTVRGFEVRRFTDASALNLTLEYRHRIGRRLEPGVFIDGGQVGPEIGDFALNRFHTGYGARLIVLAAGSQLVSFDIARSGEPGNQPSVKFYVDFHPRF